MGLLERNIARTNLLSSFISIIFGWVVLAEREALVSILKLTIEGPAKIGDIAKDARVLNQVVHQVIEKSSGLGFIELDGKLITARGEQRLRIACRAIELGVDIERVCKLLLWTEFEDISVMAFEANDFKIKKHFRFSWSGRRSEIDILGLKEPIVVSADCKHWRHGWRGSASRKASEKQAERTRALAEASISLHRKIGIEKWKDAYFVPMVLSLMPGAIKLYNGLPVVSVLQLRDFLQKMPGYIDEIKHFHVHPGKPEDHPQHHVSKKT